MNAARAAGLLIAGFCLFACGVPNTVEFPTMAATPTPTDRLTPAQPTPTPSAVPTPTPTPRVVPMPTIDGGEVVVRVGDGVFVAEVADDQAEQIQGLSGRESMPSDRAMWFEYNAEHYASFWMKGMMFPLDIVWIDRALTVVDVTHNAPVPAAEATPDQLPQYSPSVPIQYVLEINAGLASELGIFPGAKVSLGRR